MPKFVVFILIWKLKEKKNEEIKRKGKKKKFLTAKYQLRALSYYSIKGKRNIRQGGKKPVTSMRKQQKQNRIMKRDNDR